MEVLIKFKSRFRNKIYRISSISNISSPTYLSHQDQKLLWNFKIMAREEIHGKDHKFRENFQPIREVWSSVGRKLSQKSGEVP